MAYPTIPDSKRALDQLTEYARLKHEYGSTGIEPILTETQALLEAQIGKIKALTEDAELRAREPDDLPSIRALRTPAPRALWQTFDEQRYRNRLTGAFIGRAAGCTLGAIVEL